MSPERSEESRGGRSSAQVSREPPGGAGRKFVQWVLACSAGAWLIYEATGTAVDV